MSPSQAIQLSCDVRTIFGKKNRALRKAQQVPGVIYGEGQEPLPISIPYKTFVDVYRSAGETTIVECHVDGKKIPTLISDVTIHPVKDTVLHVDLRKVNLTKKVEASVPVVLTGESPAVKAGGVVLQQMQEVTVEALPQNIPHDIVIDLTTILEIGQEIKVSHLPTSDSYTIVDEPDRVVVSVAAHREESTEAQTERAETEITTAKAPEGAEGEEGATPVAEPQTPEVKE